MHETSFQYRLQTTPSALTPTMLNRLTFLIMQLIIINASADVISEPEYVEEKQSI